MVTTQTKSLNRPEEIRTFPLTTIEVISFGELSLMKLTFQPGWRWSEHVKPSVGTQSCEVPHFNYGLSEHLHVRMNDGSESEIGPGDAQVGIVNLKISVVKLSSFTPHFADDFGENDP